MLFCCCCSVVAVLLLLCLAQRQHIEIEQKRSQNWSLGESTCHSHPIRLIPANGGKVTPAFEIRPEPLLQTVCNVQTLAAVVSHLMVKHHRVCVPTKIVTRNLISVIPLTVSQSCAVFPDAKSNPTSVSSHASMRKEKKATHLTLSQP